MYIVQQLSELVNFCFLYHNLGPFVNHKLDSHTGRDIGATGRSQADAPEIDGAVYLRNVAATLKSGDIVQVEIEDADAHDLFGVIA